MHQQKFGDVVLLNLLSEIFQQHLALFLHGFDFLGQKTETSQFRFDRFV